MAKGRKPNINFSSDGANGFYIVTNGTQTEKNYFSAFQEKYKTHYNVKIIVNDTNPHKLVNYSEQFLTKPDCNQVWCVFDTDSCRGNDNNIAAAYLEAAKFGIHICYSNPAFEVWLINHFQLVPLGLEPNKLIPTIDDHFLKVHSKAHYEKNDKELLKKYFISHVEDALDIEARQYIQNKKQQIKNGDNTPFWNMSNTSDVFKLINALLDRPPIE